MSARRHTWLALVALAACTPPEPGLLPCVLALEAAGSADVALSGNAACPGRVVLSARVATGAADAPTWSAASSSPLELRGEWAVNGAQATRSVVVHNSGAAPVALVGLEWSSGDDGLTLPADRQLHNGYQSWSYTGVVRLAARVPEARGTAQPSGADEDLTTAQRGLSWWWTWLGDDTGYGLVAGATGATVLKTFLAVDGGRTPRLRIVQGLTGDSVVIAPGASLTLDGLSLSLGAITPSLEAYAETVAALHPSITPRRPALGGWGSWNLVYTDVTAAVMRTEAAWVAEQLAPLGLRDVLLDDGYPPRWGTWEASSTFGAALGTVATEQTAQGLRPALWLAPFYVDVRDDRIAAHPEYFVHRADGTLRTFSNAGPLYAALDVTNPEAKALVTGALQRLWSEGYRTFKLDFLFGGAIEGVRREPLTGLQSYARWMEAIRAAVPDAHLVGCGAPVLPSVGTFDSFRTGPDIAFEPSPTPAYVFVSAQARHSALRAFTDRWWALDPDVVLLRGDTLDDVEAFTAVVSAAMTGGNYLLGDGRQTSALRLAMALHPDVLSLSRDGVAGRPLDAAEPLEDDAVPSPLYALAAGIDARVPHLWTKPGALAVFAWNDEAYSTEVKLPAGAYEVTAAGAQPLEGNQSLSVPRHGARLFRLPAPAAGSN
ncbi:MAG: alpha-galactosidase [Archangium sp.]|nr:alpha-galactosidase [Archangium sp.]